ncbi:MAG: ribosomal protein S18-alanine N-acetyltransferase [Thermoleophilia bacterium]|nr:ribosomal protein S18-alanine N-acetyltransferase [Thermoleophilia bacterium]
MAEIRPMRLSDLKQVLEIEQSSFPRPWSLNAFITQLAKDSSVCLVAVDDGMIVGYIIATQYVEVWHMLDLAVHDGYRRKYLATDMIERFLDICCSDKHRGFTLEVRKSNRGAIKMYESFGFICTGIRKGYYSDNGEDALIMWKDSEDMLA